MAVRINGAITLDFIVDSGASDVHIPADVAVTLARAGTIASSDFIGDREYRIADGSTLKSSRFILRELKVGSRVVQNVVANIGSAKAEPLRLIATVTPSAVTLTKSAQPSPSTSIRNTVSEFR